MGRMVARATHRVRSHHLRYGGCDCLLPHQFANGLHFARVAEAEIFTQKNGLTGDYVECVLEDREGDIWVGTKMGLDRFRRGALSPLWFPPGSSDFTMVAGNDDTVWAAAGNHQEIMRIRDGRIVDKRHSGFVACAYRDPDGQIWIGRVSESPPMLGTISRLQDARSNRIEVPGEYVQAITKDSSGGLWVSVPRKGVFHLQDGKWTSLESLGGPRTTAPSEFTDSEGRVWFGFLNNTVAMLDGDRLRIYSPKDGVLVGNVMTIQGHGTHVWIGGDLGIELSDGSRFRPIIAANGETFGAVYGIVETAANGLWFTDNRGIVHIPEAELKLMLQYPGYRPNFKILDVLDGLPAELQRAEQVPTVIESTDGLLWFSTIQGLAWLDPNHIPMNSVPPPVSVLSIIANGKKYYSSLPLTLPARTRNVEILYTALSLSIPERVRFRYMLEGQDLTWQDAGTRREAFYTNLGPGSYRFRVIACNNDGVWNETGAALSFFIAPAIYQTLWFRLLYAVAGVGVLWFFFFIRMRQVTLQVRTRLEERVEERERIARELHDTLLQGFQGLILRFQAITNRITKEDPTHDMMERALEHADEVLLEGRERVRNLRSEETVIVGLSEALTSCVNELSHDRRADISVSVVGPPQVLHAVVRDEAFRVGREALANALKHSNALKIEAEITYDSTGLSLRVRDNGDGIDETILNSGRPGHWGLSGMRERAKKIGARLNLWSRLGAGTEVELIVPASIAYSTGLARSRWYWFRRIIGGGR